MRVILCLLKAWGITKFGGKTWGTYYLRISRRFVQSPNLALVLYQKIEHGSIVSFLSSWNTRQYSVHVRSVRATMDDQESSTTRHLQHTMAISRLLEVYWLVSYSQEFQHLSLFLKKVFHRFDRLLKPRYSTLIKLLASTQSIIFDQALVCLQIQLNLGISLVHFKFAHGIWRRFVRKYFVGFRSYS